MKPTNLLALPALVAALYGSTLALPAHADAPPPSAAANNPLAIPFEKYTLPNGLEVILVENHKLPIVAVNIWYHVGPANEAPGLTGFAHLFEHMMFAATKHVPRGLADKLLEGAGATDSNGSTDFDRTNYFDTVPSNQLELALWTHSDRMGYLLDVLDQTALSNQQDVVRNERRQSVENRPYGLATEALFHNLFPKTHPYYASVIGSHADIQNAKLSDVREFFERYYGPNNASLVIAGDIDKAKTKKLVARYFGTFKRGADVPKPSVATPPLTQERRVTVQDQVELPRVYLGWLTPQAFQPGDAALSIAAQILGGGKSSRLYKSLVYDKQIAQDMSATQNSLALQSVFDIESTARPGHTTQELEAAIDAELADLVAKGPTEREMERARNVIETAMLGSVEKLGGNGLANQMNQYNQYTGDPGYLPKDLARYRAVTAADVQQAVRQYLRKDARVVVEAVPGKKDLGAEVPTPAPSKAKPQPGKALNADEKWRYAPPKAGPAPSFTLPKGQSFTLPNGLTVIHHYNPALPLVSAELVLKAGSEANPVAKPGLAGYTAQLLEEGTVSRNALQIADEVAQLGAQLDTGSSPDEAQIGVVALKANFGKALDIVADLAQHPAFPDAEVERQRASRLGELAQLRDIPGAVAGTVSAAVLYGPQHPYGYPEIGTEASIKATARAELLDFWKRYYVPNNAALVVSGDIQQDELKALVQERFGAWARADVPATQAGAIKPADAKVYLVDKPGSPQTYLRLATQGPARNTPDYPALQVMNAAFGGLFTSRLNTNLREVKGYSYGIYSRFLYRRGPGSFVVAGSVRTDVTGPALDEAFKEANGMRAKPLGAKELAYAKNSQILSLPGLFETNQAIGGSLANTWVYGLPLDYYSTLPQQFGGVTAGQVQDAAKRYLDPARLVVIGVGDKKVIQPQIDKLKLGPVQERDADGQVR
ncbi:insulinase family protein [Massilia arenosa]|uniref:Insulinase family protein n=1 Tax=Zemynaea arenosa TaxID=2561931 RepID=A0A4Y9SJ61_9BURK|nr:pitrilysin family protein [Massilia arenosa]TFW25458.1 insulinase family protein [Massilia arenosa]